MKASNFPKLRIPKDMSLADMAALVQRSFNFAMEQLNSLFHSLSFEDNFKSFEVTVTIAAATELEIPNQLGPNGITPSRRVIVRGDVNSASVTDGATAWTQNFVYLKNNGANATTVTVVFLR